MVCATCESALSFTSSITRKRATLVTSFMKVVNSAEYKKCFICKAILDAILNPQSAFGGIASMAGQVLTVEGSLTDEVRFTLGISAEIGSRPAAGGVFENDIVLKIRWRPAGVPTGHWAAGSSHDEVTLFFSPQSKDQDLDYSLALRSVDTGMSWYRGARNSKCPDCQVDRVNLSDEEFRVCAEGDDKPYEEILVQQAEGLEPDDGMPSLDILRLVAPLPAARIRAVAKECPKDGLRVGTWDRSNRTSQLNSSTGSTSSWSQIESWIDICHRTHPKCRKPTFEDNDSQPREYPTRLLDIGDDSDPEGPLRLCLPKEAAIRGDYLTLSHCWGTEPVISLTSDNYDSFLRRIEFDQLPQSFRDTVVVARKLRVRYLWIDSLCIIQQGPGAKEDWLRESALMGQVYRNAFLNIGATGVTDGRGGCFQQRDYNEVYRPVIYKPECLTHCEKFYQPYTLVEDSFLDKWLLNEPLLRRGWVFQERFLAPRMLHFGSKQLFWECQEMVVCETFPMHMLPSSHLASFSDMIESTKRSVEKSLVQHMGLYHWYTIVREYSSKALTRPEDKLAAISGVAEQYQRSILGGDIEYWAGIWRSDMPHGLCWKLEDGQGTRPEEYRAPSWSWASVDGVVERPSVGRVVTGRFLAALGEPKIEYLSEANKFGPVKAAHMHLNTRLVTVEAVRKREAPQAQYVLSINGVEIEKSRWYPDENPETPSTSLVCACFATGKNGMYGITVRRARGQGQEDKQEQPVVSSDGKKGAWGPISANIDALGNGVNALDIVTNDPASTDPSPTRTSANCVEEKSDHATGTDVDDDDDMDLWEMDDYVRTGVFKIDPPEDAGDEWCCPMSPFIELWEMDLDQEDWLRLL